MQISAPTLRKHYRVELDTGHIQANAKVAKKFVPVSTHSTNPNITAIIFWLRTRRLAGKTRNALRCPVAMGRRLNRRLDWR